MDPAERRCTQLFINRTEHYEASSVKELSAKNYEYRKDSGSDFFPCNTYASLLKKISVGLNIQLNKKVISIERSQNIVTVGCSDGSVYLCKKILVSLPLGVLKSNTVKITPDIPEPHQRAIDKLGVGLMNKVILSFSQKFWGPVYWISIGCD